MSCFKLIVGAGRPDYNMAFDEWLLAQVIKEPGSFYARLYSWTEGCLTIGVNQRQETALDFSKLGNTPVIRRVTGGRALYHDISELTYSIAFNTEQPPSDELSGSIGMTSEVIASALKEFLKQLGINSDWVKRSKPTEGRPDFFHKAPCFESAGKYELLSAGEKVIASAQRRFRSGILQHGSVKLSPTVAHPALNGRAGPVSAPKAIEEKQLAGFSQPFAEAFGKKCGVELSCVDLLPEQRAALDSYENLVKEFRLERRLNIEQTCEPLGLF